ncbi:MAG: hypothetical protein AB1540_05455 [Bdellovibrionota bacterium]
MRTAKGENKSNNGPIVKLEVELEKTIVEQLTLMESHTKITRSELVTTALKRFISAHKDYFPDDYKSSS